MIETDTVIPGYESWRHQTFAKGKISITRTMLSTKKSLQCHSLSFYCVKMSSTSDKQSLFATQSNFFLFKKPCEKEDDGLKCQKTS